MRRTPAVSQNREPRRRPGRLLKSRNLGRTVTRRLIATVVVMGTIVAACTTTTFDSAGDRSTSWIGDVPATELTVATVFNITTLPPVETVDLTSAGGMLWVNDEIAPVVPDGESLEAERVIDRIWDTSTGVDSFVQAHRSDITAAFPGIQFPGVVPVGVEHVTSQLVFNPSGGVLGEPWFAAFGLWTSEPYSVSRELGQSAVFFVGSNPDPEAEAPTLLCATLQLADALACEDVDLAETRAALFTVDGGIRLQWDSGSYRYQLFFRDPDDQLLPMLMADSLVDLGRLETDAFEAYRAVAAAFGD